MSDSSDTTALSAVMAAAQRENLGALRASFAPKRVNAAALIGMFIFGLIGLIVVVGIYFFVVAFQTPNLNRSRAARRLHFFDGGLIVADANGPTAVFRWDSMSVLQAITRRYANGVYVGTTYVYTLSGANGVTAKVTNFFADPEKWGPMIQNEVTRAQLPDAVARVRAGATLEFGPIAVNRAGITSGSKSLRWDEVKDVDIHRGYVRIKKTSGWVQWSTKMVKTLPNFIVFLAVVDELRASAAQQSAS